MRNMPHPSESKMPNVHQRIALPLCAILLVCACNPPDEEPADAGATMAAAAFSSQFTLIDTVVLEQPDSLPIVRISGLDRGVDGTFVVSDPSEAVVKVFDPDGGLRLVIGRKGRGPGEFQVPEFAQFDSRGRIHVLDNRLQRISVFTPDGRLIRNVPIRDFLLVADLVVIGEGEYLAAAFRRQRDRNILFSLDSLGRVRSGHLPQANFVPRGERDVPFWTSVRRPSLTSTGNRVSVVLSIADSLWTVDLGQKAVEGEHVPVPDYKRPYAAKPNEIRGVPDVLKWAKSFSTTSDVLSTDGLLLVPFVQGTAYDGDPTTVALRDPNGRWLALTGSPPLLAADDGELIALHTPGADRVVLARYRRRG
jgi:hypothetical protein